jgi:hypothetical protein
MDKRFALVFVLVLALLSLIMVRSDYASAQSTTPTPPPVTPSSSPASSPTPTPTPSIPTPTPFIPKPAVPEFTVKLIHSFPEENRTTLELTIKNQPFDKNNTDHYSFFYNVRTRINDENWTDLYKAEDGYPAQSDSDYTVLSFSSSINNSDGWFKSTAYTYPYHWIYAPSGAEIDFQVQAMIGYRDRSWKDYANGILPYAFTGETSGWSNTQTLAISESQASGTAILDIIIKAVVLLVIASVAVGVLVYCRKRGHGGESS